MASGKSPPLDRGAVPWLLAAALATTAPHAGHLPLWLTLLAGTALFSQRLIAVSLQFGLLKDLALGWRQFGQRLIQRLPQQRFQILLFRRLRYAKQRLCKLILRQKVIRVHIAR